MLPLHPLTHRPRRRQGFTLIELIAVMGVILAISMIVVGSYIGITRAMAARAGISHLANAVRLTRQHACMDGQRTYLYVLDETRYVICRRAGVVTARGGAGAGGTWTFQDAYGDLSSFVNTLNENQRGLRIFDMSLTAGHPPFARVVSVVWNEVQRVWIVTFERDPEFPPPPGSIFQAGHVYGIELYTVRELPKGHRFREGSTRGYLYFEPTGASGGTLQKIELIETITPNLVQWVEVRNGQITVETAGTTGED